MICEMTLPLLFLQADHLFFGKLFHMCFQELLQHHEMIPKRKFISVIVFIQLMFAVWDAHNVQRRVGTVVEWAEGRGGLVVGWGGCECDGLVSNTLSLSMSATSTHPSMVSHSPVCFKVIVFVATSISVLVLICCSLSNPILDSDRVWGYCDSNPIISHEYPYLKRKHQRMV